MAFKFGDRSTKRMSGVNYLLIECAILALSESDFDMTVPWRGGLRTAEEQNEIFRDGASKADGYEWLSNHQTGYALDVEPVGYNKETTSRKYLDKARNHFAQKMFDAWQMIQEMHDEAKEYNLHWGGLWGASGWDKPHWELVRVK